jgi:hypothetical protein
MDARALDGIEETAEQTSRIEGISHGRKPNSRTMHEWLRQPPKPHDEMKLGKA